MTNPADWRVEPVDEDPVPDPADSEQHRDHRDPGDRERLRGREPGWFRALPRERDR